MSIVSRFLERVETWFESRLSDWDEADVAAAGCCTPDHLLPSDGSVADRSEPVSSSAGHDGGPDGDAPGREAATDFDCRCCGS